MTSNTAHLADPMREFAGQVERCEIVRAADIVFPAVAGPEQDAAVIAHRRLGNLHVEMIAVEDNLAGNGNASLVGAEVVGTGSRPSAVAMRRS